MSSGFLVGVDTGSNPPNGLAGGHAYSVMGAYQLTDSSGNVLHKLFRIRNPWGIDSYWGAWNDGDSRWTAAFKAQVPYANANDGYFFVENTDFVNFFFYFQVNYVRDTWNTNYYERKNDNGAWNSYTFTLPSAQTVYIAADFYNPRMYAPGCRGGK